MKYRITFSVKPKNGKILKKSFVREFNSEEDLNSLLGELDHFEMKCSYFFNRPMKHALFSSFKVTLIYGRD